MQDDAIDGFRLSPQQRRLWHLQQRLGASPFEVRGDLEIAGDLDAGALRGALRFVVDRY